MDRELVLREAVADDGAERLKDVNGRCILDAAVKAAKGPLSVQVPEYAFVGRLRTFTSAVGGWPV